MSALTGFGPWPTHLASSAVRGGDVVNVELLLDSDVEVVVVLAALPPPPEQAAISSSALNAAAKDRPRNLPNGFLDLARLDTGRTDVDALRRTVDDGPDPLDVGIPTPL
jgi:hypothetical protein